MSSIFKRGKVWWILYYSNGKRIRQSLATPNKGVALLRQRIIDGERKELRESGGLKQAFADWTQTHKKAVSNSHYRNTVQRGQLFVDYIGDFWSLNHMKCQQWIDRVSYDKSSGTVRGYLSAASAFCRYLVRSGAIESNPCKDIVLPKIKRLPPRYLDEREYGIALRLAKRSGIYLPVLTALKTGMRMNELRNIKWENIDIGRRVITIPETKTNRPRVVPIAPDLLNELDKIRQTKGPLFVGKRGGFVGGKQWRELLKPLQRWIPKFTAGHKGTGTAWHLLRHTFASRYVQAGGDIYRLAKILGHSNVTTTQRYAHLAPAHDDVMERI